VINLGGSTGNLGNRFANIAPTFQYWRLKKLRAYSVVDTAGGIAYSSGTSAFYASGVFHAIGFTSVGAEEDNAPGTVALLSQWPHFDCANGYERATVNVGPAGLTATTPEKWYVTGVVGTQTAETSAGQVCFYLAYTDANGGAIIHTVIIEGVAEFKAPLDPAESFKLYKQLVISKEATPESKGPKIEMT